MAISKIKTGSITDSAIDTNKLAANSVTSTDLSTTSITGQTELAETASGSDILLIYDASSGTLKKIQASNVGLQTPTISSVSPTSALTGDGTGNHTFIITGTGYGATAIPTLITDGGSSVSFDSFTINSQTQITGTIAKSSLTNANEPYDVKVQVAGALTATLENQINIDAQPAFNTASGSLGSFPQETEITPITIEATDPESAGAVGYEIIGSLPAGLTSSVSAGILTISGTLSTDVASSTTTTFTVKANDVASNTSTRSFSITEIPSGIESFTSSGTFSVPSGITSVDVLVVAGGGSGGKQHGGGGGSGGLVFKPGFAVTPGGTVSVTVGDGGAGAPFPFTPDTQPRAPAGQDSVFGTLTAKGGGAAGVWSNPAAPARSEGEPGGSGGGGAPMGGSSADTNGGSGTQPTQPGDSGTFGFGNSGGYGLGASHPLGPSYSGGGGGGAGAAGGPVVMPGPTGGAGGVGRAYTIADGTTPVYYAGGGGGGSHNGPPSALGGAGGQGGGGAGNTLVAPVVGAGQSGQSGQANKGGGGGGSAQGDAPGGAPGIGAGGKGIVIVKY